MTTDEQAATIAELQLRRPIAQWRGMTPSAVCAGSEAQKLYCIQDAQADILTQAAEIKRLQLAVSAAYAEIKNLGNEVNQHDQKEGKSQFALDKAEARATAAERALADAQQQIKTLEGEIECHDTEETGWQHDLKQARDSEADALAALSAAEGEGYVLVPKERLEQWARDIDNEGTPYQAGPTAEEIRAILAAAISALAEER